MKVSELINKLKVLEPLYGDLEVVLPHFNKHEEVYETTHLCDIVVTDEDGFVAIAPNRAKYLELRGCG